MSHRIIVLALVVVSVGARFSFGQAIALPPPQTGQATYQPAAEEAVVPEIFRLPPATFDYEQEFIKGPQPEKMECSLVRFPSPLVTPHPNNNTVHCEYFRPRTEGKHPGVIVLHILGGDFDLSRAFCRQMAMKDVAALFLIMPYYGPREQPGVKVEMISPDPYQTVRGMRQAVLDIRRAGGWLATRPEVDAEQLGIMGISLGGITSALAGAVEPRFKKMYLMLAGGDIGQVMLASEALPELVEARKRWIDAGHTDQELVDILRPVDPAQYGANVRGRKVMMLNAKNDEIVPPACTVALWEAFGQPEIMWVNAGHYSAMRFIPGALAKAVAFFQAETAASE